MPARGERAAPTFDKTKPRELLRFFDDLEYLMERAAITSETDKKKQAVRYTDFDTEQVWKTFPEFKNNTTTYLEFKQAILVHYPDASGDFIYSLRDMDLLIGERQRIGISSTQDLSDYHLQFMSITTWLKEKKHLGELEQQRAYIRAFQTALLTAIQNRLQLKNPDHHPSIPHTVEKVYEAARFVLQGTTQSYFPTTTHPAAQAAITSKSANYEPTVKREELNTIFAEFTKNIVEVLNQNNRGRANNNNNAATRQTSCNFCGEEHYIRECKHVDEYCRAGKCKRNQDNKVVLPSGAFVPREIPGTLLKDRIEEWHRRNPNQLAAVTMLHTIDMRIVKGEPTVEAHSTFALSSQDRIATLEAELYALKTRKPNQASNIQTRAQRRTRDQIEEDSDSEEVAAIRGNQQARIEEVIEETPAIITQAKKTTNDNRPIIMDQAPQVAQKEPEHAYRNVKDAAYIPPTQPNVGSLPKPPLKRNDIAYRTLPPVQDPEIAKTVFTRAMDSPLTITQRELLSLSPEIRSQVREITTSRRITTKDIIANQHLLQEGDSDSLEERDSNNTNTYAMSIGNIQTPPAGALIISDPIETYYKSLNPGEAPDFDQLVVALESGAVRSVLAIVDANRKKECILDPGSQIVAMSEESCHDLDLSYDPGIVLNMESANGSIDRSLGLARNVPFQIGEIIFYIQVHVIRSPAYDILLGRPFDILTESVVRNFANGDQTITIHDPNTGKRATVPTFSRGKYSCTKHRKECAKGFHERRG